MYRRNSRSSGGGGGAIKCQGWKGRENWSKLCSLGGRVSTLALILKGEMYLIYPFGCSVIKNDSLRFSHFRSFLIPSVAVVHFSSGLYRSIWFYEKFVITSQN